VKVVRAALTVLVFVGIGALVAALISSRTDSGSGGYMVRAVFDNSSFVIPGEDVKVAGVKVGTIRAVDLTAQNKAAIVLEIDNSRFAPFRADAHCEIGIESLLGEQFVQCTPTQPVPSGAAPAQPLASIASGPDKGQHLLPVQNTTTPVGLDQLADITRLPQQQRLQLVISGLGAGLAGNGEELNAALLRADPALAQTDQVIATLAGQNHTLARLTDESDRILAPLAAQRAHVGGFIQHVGTVATAAAQQGSAIEQNLEAFPPFLRQLKPAAQRLNRLARQVTATLAPLEAQAPAVNAAVQRLGPLATSGTPAVKTLGNVAQRGEVAFPRINQVAGQLLDLATPLQPLASNLAQLSSSFDNAGGIEDVMRFIYYYTGTVNGEDALGHYVRSSFEVGACSARSSSKVGGCGSTFATTTIAKAAASSPKRQRGGLTFPPAGRALLDYLLRP
jgi:virulence factor Mce-like protein